jgi:hypothetical protein
LGCVEAIEIVAQRGNMHDAGHESVRKLDHQAIIPNIHDRGAKDLRIALLELLLEKLKLL